MNQRDLLWKAILEDLFEDFLLFFFPDAEQVLDFSRGFEYLDKELEQIFPPNTNHHKPRYADKLVKVYRHNGQEEWVLIHIEVQGYYDKAFAKRMYQYYNRIWDKYDKEITAIAIFTDDNPRYHPKRYEALFMGTRTL